MKKLFLLILLILIVFITYKLTYHNDKTILIVTDSFTSGISDKKIAYNFTDELISQNPNTKFQVLQTHNFHLNDFQNAINNNEELLSTKAQHLLKESKYIILSIGLEEIISQNEAKVNIEDIINNFLTDYQQLITTIKQYNKNILLINYYQIPNFDTMLINNELSTIATQEQVKILDISSLPSSDNFLTYENQLVLSSKVNNFLSENNLLLRFFRNVSF